MNLDKIQDKLIEKMSGGERKFQEIGRLEFFLVVAVSEIFEDFRNSGRSGVT